MGTEDPDSGLHGGMMNTLPISLSPESNKIEILCVHVHLWFELGHTL